MPNANSQGLFEKDDSEHEGNQKPISQNGQPVQQSEDKLACSPLSKHRDDIGPTRRIDRQAGD